MITPAQAKRMLPHIHDLPNAKEGKGYITAQAMTGEKLQPYQMLESPFYLGTEIISEGGWARLVHVVDIEAMKKFSGLTWQQAEKERQAKVRQIEIG